MCAFLTSWYTEGLEREGTVKDNTLLCPSLSTISCERERQEDNEKKFCGWEKQKLFFPCACPKPLKSACLSFQVHSSVMCGCLCVWTWGSPSPHSVYWCMCVWLFVCILCEHMRTNPGVLVSPVCMLMSNRLMGASQCVEWQLTYSAIQRGS